MVEVYFEELGVFTGKEIENIKKALEGASYMEFQITSYCQYGNYSFDSILIKPFFKGRRIDA